MAESNEIHSCSEYGISIGHRDTDNIIRGNRVYDSGKAGLYFRPEEPPVRCAHRNTVEANLFQGAGTAEAPGIGIDLAGAVDDVIVRRNRIINPVGGHMRVGIRVACHARRLTLAENEMVGLAREVEDLRNASAPD